ncbi:glycoside hydrolase family 43 protein [Anaerosporobacter sp.]|uniref:glycoside hydrolase family 43 protein n=1 Tax=Anaerosporobacter sp. TaxID=1872529 RepID=UPI00286F0E43|nr:glycoside hydrolase family 43 protein [Anaerosporobacter sp.]
MAGYLFVHFIGEEKDGEQIYFSISKDGLHWKDLNQGKPILYSDLGDKGVRDPFIVKEPTTGKYFLIATDLCIGKRKGGWESACKNGSRDLIVWESDNLIDWGKAKSCRVGIPEAGCVWAPEAVYDKKEEAFFVFWASFVKEEGEAEGKHRIYSAYTKDFREFTSLQKYIEKENAIIDTTIIFDNGKYYRFSKDESNKHIIAECGDELAGQDFILIENSKLNELLGVEGPECFRLPDGKWCLVVDQYGTGKGYLPIVIEDLETAEVRVLEEKDYSFGSTKKRHGGIIAISDEEYDALQDKF